MKKYYFFYLLPLAAFLLITATELWSKGMFMDGLYYAAIAKNMAHGLGTFWTPFFSETLYPQFYEHPPLAMAMQSLLYNIFGDSIYIERIYSFLIVSGTGVLISLIWKELTQSYKNSWLPLWLWISINIISWACANNMLENTLTLFVLLASLFYLKSRTQHRQFFLIIAGSFLFAALLTKGFVALYIWAFPFFFMLFFKEKIIKTILDTAIMVSATILPVVLFYFFNDNAAHFMISYFNKQIIESITNVQTVNSRFHIFWEFTQQVLPIIAFVLISLIVGKIQKHQFTVLKTNLKHASILLAITFSGIFPIMISLKQRGFYIISVYPFFVIAVSLLMLLYWEKVLDKIIHYRLTGQIIKYTSTLLIVISIIISFLQINQVGRDHDKIHDIIVIGSVVEEGSTIRICSDLFDDWSLHAYFVRYFNIYLGDVPTNNQNYYLSYQSHCQKVPDEFTKMDLPLKKMMLFLRK